MTGLPGLVASEMMTGYQRGGLLSSGGVVGAMERGAETFLAGKLLESVAGKAGAWYADKAKAGMAPPVPGMSPGLTVAQTAESRSFQVARSRSQQQVKEYRSITGEIAEAKAAGASAAQLAELETRRLQKATELNEDFLAERMIKADGKDAHLAMQHITRSGGLESYKDLVVTTLYNPENVARINKGWAAQSAEVLQNKVTHAGTGTGEFAVLFREIDGANQAAKDIEQRLFPLLKIELDLWSSNKPPAKGSHS